VRVLMTGGRVWAATTGCWRKLRTSASPLGTGERYVFNDGGTRYLPLRRHGARTAVTFTYTWARGARATEQTTFLPGNRSPIDVTITVKGARSLTVRKSITPLTRSPSLPVPSPPRRPVPKPLCTPGASS
jgi:hypothetical protein